MELIKPTGKRPLGRPRRGWEDNIRMYLKEIGVDTRNWVDLAQDKDMRRALVNVALTSGFHKPWRLLISPLVVRYVKSLWKRYGRTILRWIC